jgi:hypothetical protein
MQSSLILIPNSIGEQHNTAISEADPLLLILNVTALLRGQLCGNHYQHNQIDEDSKSQARFR